MVHVTYFYFLNDLIGSIPLYTYRFKTCYVTSYFHQLYNLFTFAVKTSDREDVNIFGKGRREEEKI